MANKKKKKAVKKSNVSKKKRKNNTKKKSTRNTSSKRNNTVKTTSKTAKKNGKKVTNKTSTIKHEPTKKVNSSKVTRSTETKTTKKDVQPNKKKINKKVLFFTVFVVLLTLVVVLFLLFIKNSNEDTESISFENIVFDEYIELYKSKELQFIYLYHDSCVNCDNYEVNLNKLETEFDIKIKKFDYSDLNEDELASLSSSSASLSSDIDVPMLLSIKDGDEINSISGIKEYSALKNFVNSSKNPLDVKSFTKIQVNDYLSLLNSKNKSFIYICSPSNSGCETFTPVLESVSKNRKLKVNYLNTETINTSEDWDKLEGSSKIFDNVWFMPAMLIVKDGKIIDYKMEALNEEDLNEFLKENGL